MKSELKCFNGEKVYVAFSLDCHDREALAYATSKVSLLTTDIQNLVIQSVDKKFTGGKTLRDIQWQCPLWIRLKETTSITQTV